MAIKIVSDLHSATDALREEVGTEDVLLLLGDLVNLIDYRNMEGILVDLYGVESEREVDRLRREGRLEEARSLMLQRRKGREQEMGESLLRLRDEGYEQVREALAGPAYVIGGNIDPPEAIASLAGGDVVCPDGKVVRIGSFDVGFAGGGLPTPLGVAGEIPEEEFDAKLEGLGPVDVLCCHVPPDLPELTYDTVAARAERGSRGLLAYVEEYRPGLVFFGHIHQPLVSSMRLGATRFINAGYFRRTCRAVDLEPLAM